ncbi:MAG: HAMP domain-containing sensor histidine kinase [Castellaniella sp.]|uniref:sensor histidine kinase n=1 Tax=Castellaniella sp. TaxID=1955812 RepID=UPI002A3634FB|nr:HAMP domain-containing sensor histidine kinase [Castellaniella sp.]MDY0308695.1 HAMP domain-containing sensor histidine kinase [Castellaniella sp.]
MSPNRPSILARRVTWAVTGTVAVFLLVIGLLAYKTFALMEDELVDEVLAGQVAALRDDLGSGPAAQSNLPMRWSEGGRVQAWVLPANQPPPLEHMFAAGSGGREIMLAGRTWHTWVETVPQGLLYVRYDATAHENRVRAFGWILAGSAALALVCAWLLARRLARRVVAPIRAVSDRLAAWEGVTLTDEAPAGDEARQLIGAFSRIQDRIDRSVAFERQFAANLGHELRTPLAALRSDCEMALLDTGPGTPLRMRLERMMVQVDAAASSLAGAAALNSADPARMRHVDLAQVLEQAWFALEPMARARGLVLDARIPADESRFLDPDALLIVLRNLLRNAVEHAAPATLRVSLAADGALVLRDNGPGMAPERLAQVREWHAGRADLSAVAAPEADHGRGLGIAQRVCELRGWQLSVDSVHGGVGSGTIFRLDLRSASSQLDS